MSESDQKNNLHNINNDNEGKKEEQEFVLKFTQEVIDSMNTLCECIRWTPELYIRTSVMYELENLCIDIENEEYYMLSEYFDFSKIKDSEYGKKEKNDKKKTQEIHISFDFNVSEALYKVSERINWAVETYIEHIAESTLKKFCSAIKEGVYQELFEYFDLSDITPTLRKLMLKGG